MERWDLQTQALEDTAGAWDWLSEVLADSAAQVRGVAGAAGAAEWWPDVLAEVEEACRLTSGWAESLRGVLDDLTGVEARVVADLGEVLRRLRGEQ